MPTEKDFEAILKNVIDGYLPEAVEKNLPALRSSETSLDQIQIELALAHAVLAIILIMPDRKNAIESVEAIAEGFKRRWKRETPSLDMLLAILSERSPD